VSVRLQFFGGVREAFGQAEQSVELPEGVATVGALREHLCTQGGPWSALAAGRARIAVNGMLVDSLRTPLRDGDELAVFPLIEGG
jgi:molybdopterin synthase sulfur carrier subunit